MHRGRIPNWRKWRAVPVVKAWEGVALSLNIEPDEVSHREDSWMSGVHGFRESREFKDRVFILGRNFGRRLRPTAIVAGDPANCRVSLSELAGWAVSLGWEVPPEFAALAATSADREPVKGEKTAESGEESPLRQRERATLLTIIAALARQANIEVAEPFKAADIIENLTGEIGARIPARTIAEHLKRIPEAVERRGKL